MLLLHRQEGERDLKRMNWWAVAVWSVVRSGEQPYCFSGMGAVVGTSDFFLFLLFFFFCGFLFFVYIFKQW